MVASPASIIYKKVSETLKKKAWRERVGRSEPASGKKKEGAVGGRKRERENAASFFFEGWEGN